MSDYDLLGRYLSGLAELAQRGDGTFFIAIGVFIYNCIYLASIFVGGLKFASALYNYHTRVSHQIYQTQARQEIYEPLKGMIFFNLGLTVIKFVATLIFGVKFTCFQYLK
ncbi:MAG: hypothetical protein IIY49_00530 [Eubacterium sp.]|jgi:hypothetical protein|nr:hypothetical protein [Eubacterium sp.]